MRTHIALEGAGAAACGAQDGSLIPLSDALDPKGGLFDCVECHKVLTKGKRHSEPEEE